MPTMLEDILNGDQFGSCVLIQDSLLEEGIHLLRAFIKNHFARKEHIVHVLCYEHHPHHVRGYLNIPTDSANIHFHDLCSDHRGWNSGEEDKCVDILSSSGKLLGDGQSKVVLIIDSLSMVISNIGVNKCYQQMQRIIQGWPNVLLICLVHEDFLPKSSATILKLCHLATICLQVKPTVPSSHESVVQITQVKPGGKLVSSTELFFVDGNTTIVCKVIAQKKVMGPPVVVKKMPKELTTFKLELDHFEQEARNKVVLPYIRREEGGGKVFYQPDEADDWDEEDPDDDLCL